MEERNKLKVYVMAGRLFCVCVCVLVQIARVSCCVGGLIMRSHEHRAYSEKGGGGAAGCTGEGSEDGWMGVWLDGGGCRFVSSITPLPHSHFSAHEWGEGSVCVSGLYAWIKPSRSFME